MGYNSPKETKKLVGGIMRKRTVVLMVVALLLFVYYPTIRNMATQYDAMVVEKVDATLDYSTRKGAVRHQDYKEIILCDANGREFEKTVENAVYDRIKEGGFVQKKYLDDKFKIVETVPGADQIKAVCTIHPPKPKPEPKKKQEPPPPPPAPPPEKPIVPQAPVDDPSKAPPAPGK